MLSMALVLFIQTESQAQGSTNSLTLEQAIAYAMEHNPNLQNKKLDVDYAKGQVLETTSIGLPQVNGSFNFQNNLELPVFVFPNPATGEQTPIRVGQKFNTTAGISVSQLIFDGQYLLGLKAAQEFVKMASSLEILSASQLKNQVTQTYLMVLLSAESMKLIEANLEMVKKTLEQTEALYKTGFAEKIDADRLRISKMNLETQLLSLKNQHDLSKDALKLTMGMPIENSIELTDKIEQLAVIELSILNETADYKNRPEYTVLTTQQKLNDLNLKRYKVSMIPSLAAFYNYQQAFYGDELDFDPWFGTSLWGLNMSIPIFKGMNTKAQLDKVGVDILKTNNDLANLKMAVSLEVNQHKSRYNTLLSNLEVQKQNVKLAEEVLAITLKKLENGMSGNLEVISAQTDLKTAQTNYIQSLYELALTRAQLNQALGK